MVSIVIYVGETSLLISLVSIVSPICKDRKERVLACGRGRGWEDLGEWH